MDNKIIVLCSGGYDPVHSGHIAYFESAKKLGDYLIVGLNSDQWLARKKGKPFMPMQERSAVIGNLSMVDEVYQFHDHDDADGSCVKFIENVLHNYPNNKIIFANGGDRTSGNIPEMSVNNPRLSFKFGVGGENKANSSSWILQEWASPKTLRSWGWYHVLNEQPGYKVKKLVIEPGKSLSMQRHFKRSEHWYVIQGHCSLTTEHKNETVTKTINQFSDGVVINPGVWHQASNISDSECHVLEVQYGDQCVEHDIERRDQ